MIIRNARLIIAVDCTILLCSVVTSLLGARVLGPPGRGDLFVITVWPLVVALLAELGLPNAYRYWMAKEPNRVSRLFSNALIYTIVVGAASIALSGLILPHVVVQRSAGIMLLMRIYLLNVPAVILFDLMRGLLEGTRRFGWAGAARLIFFSIQAVGFAGLWLIDRFTVATAAYTMMLAQATSMLLALWSVWRQFRPRWEPSWNEFKTSMHYGLRDYAGGVADYTTLRLDQIMLGGMASSGAIGLYVVAVRLSEITTFAGGALANALMPEVASSRASDRAEALLGRTLRLTFYLNALVLVPLWWAAPLILRTLFGQSFLPATGAFRWLLVAAVVWSASTIVISGLQGFGYPGLSTIARFLSAIVTAVALLMLLPRMGIVGAALSSLIGYSVMLGAGLFALIRRRQLGFWRYLRPQRHDIPFAELKSLATLSLLSARSTEG